MKLALKKGSTDITVHIFIQDSTSTSGAGKTGLAYDTASLTCYYARPGAAAAALSLVTQTITGAHTDGGFVEIDATNMPGVYRLDLSDAILASGVNSVVVMLNGASGMAPLPLEIQLTDFDLNDAEPDVNVTKFGGTAVTGRDLGAQLDAAITTRLAASSYVSPPDTASIATAVWAAGTRTLTGFGTLAADIWGYATRTLTAMSDSSGVTTLLGRIASALTITSGKVDVNDKSGFSLSTAPPTAAEIKTALEAAGSHLAGIKDKTDNLPADPASETNVSTRLAAASYTEPDNTGISGIKAQTDKLTFDAANRVAGNMTAVNNQALTGDGSSVTPWGPAS
jgi:hypothetical protein